MFASPGDSGSWCLDGNGGLVGLLIGGDKEDGTGLMIPIDLVLRDVGRQLGVSPGSFSFSLM